MSSKRGYPVVGGPLDGQLARFADFEQEIVAPRDRPATDLFGTGEVKKGTVLREGGKFGKYANHYAAFNRNGQSNVPTMIWLWTRLVTCQSWLPRGEGQYPNAKCELPLAHAGKHAARVDGRRLRWSDPS